MLGRQWEGLNRKAPVLPALHCFSLCLSASVCAQGFRYLYVCMVAVRVRPPSPCHSAHMTQKERQRASGKTWSHIRFACMRNRLLWPCLHKKRDEWGYIFRLFRRLFSSSYDLYFALDHPAFPHQMCFLMAQLQLFFHQFVPPSGLPRCVIPRLTVSRLCVQVWTWRRGPGRWSWRWTSTSREPARTPG